MLTRWLIINGCSACKPCHDWAQTHKSEFLEWWESQIGPEPFADLESLSHSTEKFRTTDLNDLVTLYRGSV
jgi:hypothetical protein